MKTNNNNQNVADAIRSVKEAVSQVLIGTSSQVNKIQLQRLDLIKELKSSKDRVSNIEKELLEVEEFLKWSALVTKGVNSLQPKVRQAPCKKAEVAGDSLGDPYYSSRGVAMWLCKAAEQGDAAAQYSLGVAYANGEGGVKDQVEAVKWWSKAAEQGHANAQFDLGCSRYFGLGVADDPVEGVEWWMKAADQGHAHAQYRLGIAYDSGEGVEQDQEEAVKWWRKAAEQGYAPAQNNLGFAYSVDNDRGVATDQVEAVKWYRKAAEQGHSHAQKRLGDAYAHGMGVAKDRVESDRWYAMAEE